MDGIDQVAQSLLQSELWNNLAPPVQMALLTGSLVLLPAAIASMTAFTRVAIVLSFIRRAMGTQEIPPTPVMLGLALFLTYFIMAPTFERISDEAVLPYLNDEMSGVMAIQVGAEIQKEFMLRHTRKRDLALFLHFANEDFPETPEATPLRVLVPAFMISELKTAFLMGFCIYIPFLMVDLIVATTIMSMGMWMMPPVIISAPIKLLLFVLTDGWHLVSLSITQSFA